MTDANVLSMNSNHQVLDLCAGFELDFNKIGAAKQEKIVSSWDTTLSDASSAFNNMKTDILDDITKAHQIITKTKDD